MAEQTGGVVEKNIAIIVPAYNASTTIRQTLESIQLQQSGLNRLTSVVVVDDHSTDDTTAIVRSCSIPNVPLVVSRNSENKGERVTVNEAVDALPANVDWFFILHADDIAKPNWLEVMLRGIDQATPCTASFTASYDVLFPDGHVETGENFGEALKVIVKGTPQSIRETLRQGCWFKISSCAIRLSALRDVGGFMPDMPQLGDWDFVLRILRAGLTIEYIPLCLSFYRQTSQSVSSKSFQEHRDIKEGLTILDRYRDFMCFTDMASRHGLYLYMLARRAAASVVRGDFERLKTAIAVGILVIASFFTNCLRSNEK